MAYRIEIDVTFPSGKTRSFRSISRVARMLSGNGTASGGLRREIEWKSRHSLNGFGCWYVRNGIRVYG